MKNSKISLKKKKLISSNSKNINSLNFLNLKNLEKCEKKKILEKPKKLEEEKVVNFLEKMRDKKSNHLFSSNFKKDLKKWFPYLTPSSNINIDFNIYISKKENLEKKKIFEKFEKKKNFKKEIVNENFFEKNNFLEKKKINEKNFEKINEKNFEKKNEKNFEEKNNFEIFLPKAKRINLIKEKKSKIKSFEDFLNFRINFEDTISDEIFPKDKLFFQINKLKNFWIKKDNTKTPFVFIRQRISINEFDGINEIIDFSQKIA